MATYGGGSLIQQVSVISTGNISNGFTGTIYTAPSDCEYVHLTFTLFENVGGTIISPQGYMRIETQGISNPAWVTQVQEYLFAGLVASGFSNRAQVGGTFAGTLSDTINSGRVVSGNVAKNYNNTDTANFTFLLFRGERIIFQNNNAAAHTIRIVMNQVAFKLSSAV